MSENAQFKSQYLTPLRIVGLSWQLIATGPDQIHEKTLPIPPAPNSKPMILWTLKGAICNCGRRPVSGLAGFYAASLLRAALFRSSVTEERRKT
jgi:hypothetical protein